MTVPESVGGESAVLDEEALVARLRAGDPDAFEVLVRTHGPRVLAVTRRFLKDEQDARDAAQDVFVSVFRSIGSFSGQSRLSTWLHRIAVNSSLMRLRTRRRRPEDPIDPMLPGFAEDGHHAQEIAAWPDAEKALEREETRTAVRAAIDRLPESYRTVLLLRDIEERSTEEAAGILGITPNAVKVRLHRARLALRTLIDPYLRRGHE